MEINNKVLVECFATGLGTTLIVVPAVVAVALHNRQIRRERERFYEINHELAKLSSELHGFAEGYEIGVKDGLKQATKTKDAKLVKKVYRETGDISRELKYTDSNGTVKTAKVYQKGSELHGFAEGYEIGVKDGLKQATKTKDAKLVKNSKNESK